MLDLGYKATQAMDFRGARYLHIPVPCPLGWGSSPADTVKAARLATESGLFPVFEAEAGQVTSSTPIRRQVPVTESAGSGWSPLVPNGPRLLYPERNEQS